MGGHYAFALPAAFFPDYKKHGVKDKGAYAYEFAYEVRIIAENHISNLSIPANAVITAQNDYRTDITVRSTEPGRTVDLFYRCADMMVPKLQYARSPENDAIAVSVSLVPTFDPV